MYFKAFKIYGIIVLLLLLLFKGASAKVDSLSVWKEQASNEKNVVEKANLFSKIGTQYFGIEGKYDQALEYLFAALEIYRKKNKVSKKAQTLEVIIDILNRQNEIQKLILYLPEAETVYKELNDIGGQLKMRQIRAHLKSPADAIVSLKECLEICKENNYTKDIPNLLNNIGSYYMDIKQYDSAMHYLTKTIELAKTPDSRRILAIAIYNKGDIQRTQKNYALSNMNMIKALGILRSEEHRSAIGWLIPELVELDLKWKLDKDKVNSNPLSPKEIISLLTESRSIANDTKDFSLNKNLEEAYLLYYQYYKNKDSIIHYQNNVMMLNDSMSKNEKSLSLSKYNANLKIAEGEKEIIKLQADKRIAHANANKNKTIFVLILLGLLSSIYFIIKRIKDKNIREQESKDKEFRTKLSRDLHDDVGTILTSLSMQSELLQLKAGKDHKGTVVKIADMSRDATRRMRDTVWAIDSRKDNVMDLVYRMIDFGDDILGSKNVAFQLKHNIKGREDKISVKLRQTIFLIFKEATTNAAKYGSGDIVTAKLWKEKDKLTFNLINETYQKEGLKEISGLGISNIKTRTEEVDGKFTIETNDNSFEVKLSFPI